MKNKPLSIDDIKVPHDYFEMNIIEREVVALQIMEMLLNVLDKSLPQEVNRINALARILDDSIIMNEKAENYEICGVLSDIRNCIE
jgi:hypothetical protein